MKSISFYGAGSDEVTGSNFLLIGQHDTKLLIDFGMFQGPTRISDQNYLPLGFRPSQVTAVLLTHAHLDHCGRLPMLVFAGFTGKIYMSGPTRSLVEVVLNDAARIAADSKDHEPLYTTDQVEQVLKMIEVVEYHKVITINEFSINFLDAGHILGSSSIEIKDTVDNKTIVFSGDLGNTPEDIVRPTEYPQSADYVVMESTYGDKEHPKDDPGKILLEEINATEKEGSVLLIPAFSIERTQEILHRIHHLKKDGLVKADTPVFLDSPMGIRATIVFRDYKEFYNQELQGHINDPFGFEGLVISENSRDSKEIVKAMNPKIIIAGSGMMSGGRIMAHAVKYLPLGNTRLLFVGYQSEETIGRQILDGAKTVKIEKETVRVNAHVRQIQSFSSHADQSKLLDWLAHIKDTKKVFLVHGEKSQRDVLSQKIKEQHKNLDVLLPQNGDTVSLE